MINCYSIGAGVLSAGAGGDPTRHAYPQLCIQQFYINNNNNNKFISYGANSMSKATVPYSIIQWHHLANTEKVQ